MMESIREYLVSVTAAALICGIATKLISKGLPGSVVKLIAGIIMALAVVSPLVNIHFGDLENYTLDIQAEGEAISAEGENSAREAMAQIISEETAAYILDKAEELSATLSVQVTLSEDAYPVPEGVRLEGSVSPYAKSVLEEYITTNLGIEAEEIEWIP